METNKKLETKFTPLEDTAINLKTKEESLDYLRKVESAGWVLLNSGRPPTKWNSWESYKENTCVSAGIQTAEDGTYRTNKISFGPKKSYEKRGWNVISLQEFYEIQNKLMI